MDETTDNLLKFDLRVDEDSLEERSEAKVLADEKLHILASENWLGLQMDSTEKKIEGGIGVVDLSLRCIAHPHPDCTFRWVRLTIKLDGPNAKVLDLSPESVVGADPVKITTKYTGGLSLEVKEVKIGHLDKEHLKETRAYFPEIVGTGKGFSYVIWTFQAQEGHELHVNKELHVLVSLPPDLSSLKATFTMRAKVTGKGILGLIPLFGKKETQIELNERVL